MDEGVEFSISGSVCRVVPEDRASGALGRDGNDPDDDPSPVRVVGKIYIGGRRYLVLAQAVAAVPPGSANARVSDLLTGRELQVAMMVSEGLGNKQIAHRLGLSEWTVTSYLRRIFAKLNVRTRAAMVARIVGYVRP